MKKLITFALLAAMILTCFAGCGIRQGAVSVVNNAEGVAYNAENAGITGTLATNVALYKADGVTADTWEDGEDEDETPDVDTTWHNTDAAQTFVLDTAEKLAGFISLINAGTDTFAGDTVKLGAHINLGDQAWTLATKSFAGTFDGQGYIIYGINASVAVAGGMFGNLAAGAVVKNVGLAGTFSSTSEATGVVAGKAVTTNTGDITVENIYSDVTFTATKVCAGVVGRADGDGTLYIKNIESNGTFTTSSTGISGILGGSRTNSVVTNVTITNSINNAEVKSTAQDKAYIGGFCGYYYTSGTITIENCLNTAKVTGTAGRAVGGILGYSQVTSSTVVIRNCANTGDVSAAHHAGGIFGDSRAASVTIENCTNSGAVTVTSNGPVTNAKMSNVGGILGLSLRASQGNGTVSIKGCTNTGAIKGVKGTGGILGYSIGNTSVTVEDCTASGDVTGSGNGVGGAVGHLKSVGTVTISNVDYSGTCTTSTHQAGGVIGMVDTIVTSASVKGCDMSGSFKGTTQSGGVIGLFIDTPSITVEDCTLSGSATGTRSFGGILGFVDNDFTVVADNVVTIKNCDVTSTGVVTSALTPDNNPSVAGIVGRVRSNDFTMDGCDFAGNLHVTFTGTSKMSIAAAGLIGVLFDENAAAQVDNPVGVVKNSTVTGTLRFLDNGDDMYIAAVYVGGVFCDTKPDVTYENLSCTGVSVDTSAISGDEEGTPMTAVLNGGNPYVIGYQQTNAYNPADPTDTVAENKTAYDLRYVAALNSNADIGVGFKVTIKYYDADSNTVVTKVTDEITYAEYVYTSVTGTDKSYTNVYTAEGFYATYLYTLVIKGIPADCSVDNGTLEIAITPFTATDADTITYGYTTYHGTAVVPAA